MSQTERFTAFSKLLSKRGNILSDILRRVMGRGRENNDSALISLEENCCSNEEELNKKENS